MAAKKKPEAPRHLTTEGRVRVETNFLQLYGILGQPVKYYHTPGKKRGAMALLNIACQDPNDGSWRNWQDGIVFGPLATWCSEYLRPGMRLLCVGHLVRDRYLNRHSGKMVAKPQIKIRQVFMAPMWSDHLKEALMLADEVTPVEMVPAWADVTDDEIELEEGDPRDDIDAGDLERARLPKTEATDEA